MGLGQRPFVVSESLLQGQDVIWDAEVQDIVYSYVKGTYPRYLPCGCTIPGHYSRTALPSFSGSVQSNRLSSRATW